MPRTATMMFALWVAACRPYDPPKTTGALFEACCEGSGVCVPQGLVAAELRQQLDLTTCGSDLACVPKPWVNDPTTKPAACLAQAQFEGRCLPSCLPNVAARLQHLDTASCAAGERCVPCFDPRSGEDTHACRIQGDAPQSAPATYVQCCEDAGRCISDAALPQAVSASDRERLAPCKDAPNGRCIPSPWLDEPMPTARLCHLEEGFEGRCLPRCLPEVEKQADRLQRRDCEADALCVPCYDPVSGKDSEACRLQHDAPREPPATYAFCCSQTGRCLPRARLLASASPADVQRLAAADCVQSDTLCVPARWLETPQPAPESCRASGDLEGRCLSSCLPEVAEQAHSLERQSCGLAELCVPCFDPLTGKDSEACRSGDDAPREPARTFADCCDHGGRCVPRASIEPMSETDQLARDACGAAELCVPNALLGSPPRPSSACRTPGDQEGRCLSRCLPQIAAEANRLSRTSCASDELCVPCFDPLSGKTTDACTANGDKPREPARVFDACCRGDGRCVPRAQLETGGQQIALDRLAADSCTGSSQLCVDALWLNQRAAPECHALDGREGRCQLRCLPDVAAQAMQLAQADCSTQRACVPCFDPLSGADTGACRAPGDAPKEPARPFERCCGTGDTARGRCLPSELLTPAQVSSLPVERCSETGTRCVPEEALRQPPTAAKCSVTNAFGTSAPGVCIARCFLSGSIAASAAGAGCKSDESCIRCSLLGSAQPGCS